MMIFRDRDLRTISGALAETERLYRLKAEHSEQLGSQVIASMYKTKADNATQLYEIIYRKKGIAV